jgi:histidine triad (HIT) family protein
MPTIFERIAAGEIPCHKVWEDAQHLAFLDINPRIEGHTLVIPKNPVDYLFDLSDGETSQLWLAVKTVAGLLKKKLPCRRVCVTVIGWEVPHCHVHLLPTNSISDYKFPPLDSAAQARLAVTAKRLQA